MTIRVAPDGQELNVAGVALGEIDAAAPTGGNESCLLLGVGDEEVDELAAMRKDEAVLAPGNVPEYGAQADARGVRVRPIAGGLTVPLCTHSLA